MTRMEPLPLQLDREKMKEPSPPGIGSFFRSCGDGRLACRQFLTEFDRRAACH